MAEVHDIGKGSKGFNLEPRLCNEAVLMLGYSYWSQASAWKLLRTDRNPHEPTAKLYSQQAPHLMP